MYVQKYYGLQELVPAPVRIQYKLTNSLAGKDFFVHPLKRKNRGLRSGKPLIKPGKVIKKDKDGYDVLDDYFSESDAEFTFELHKSSIELRDVETEDDRITSSQPTPVSHRTTRNRAASSYTGRSISSSVTSKISNSKLGYNPVGWLHSKKYGRRTGKDIKAGKVIRTRPDGFENFDDYFSESDADSLMMSKLSDSTRTESPSLKEQEVKSDSQSETYMNSEASEPEDGTHSSTHKSGSSDDQNTEGSSENEEQTVVSSKSQTENELSNQHSKNRTSILTESILSSQSPSDSETSQSSTKRNVSSHRKSQRNIQNSKNKSLVNYSMSCDSNNSSISEDNPQSVSIKGDTTRSPMESTSSPGKENLSPGNVTSSHSNESESQTFITETSQSMVNANHMTQSSSSDSEHALQNGLVIQSQERRKSSRHTSEDTESHSVQGKSLGEEEEQTNQIDKKEVSNVSEKHVNEADAELQTNTNQSQRKSVDELKRNSGARSSFTDVTSLASRSRILSGNPNEISEVPLYENSNKYEKPSVQVQDYEEDRDNVEAADKVDQEKFEAKIVDNLKVSVRKSIALHNTSFESMDSIVIVDEKGKNKSLNFRTSRKSQNISSINKSIVKVDKLDKTASESDEPSHKSERANKSILENDQSEIITESVPESVSESSIADNKDDKTRSRTKRKSKRKTNVEESIIGSEVNKEESYMESKNEETSQAENPDINSSNIAADLKSSDNQSLSEVVNKESNEQDNKNPLPNSQSDNSIHDSDENKGRTTKTTRQSKRGKKGKTKNNNKNNLPKKYSLRSRGKSDVILEPESNTGKKTGRKSVAFDNNVEVAEVNENLEHEMQLETSETKELSAPDDKELSGNKDFDNPEDNDEENDSPTDEDQQQTLATKSLAIDYIDGMSQMSQAASIVIGGNKTGSLTKVENDTVGTTPSFRTRKRLSYSIAALDSSQLMQKKKRQSAPQFSSRENSVVQEHPSKSHRKTFVFDDQSDSDASNNFLFLSQSNKKKPDMEQIDTALELFDEEEHFNENKGIRKNSKTDELNNTKTIESNEVTDKQVSKTETKKKRGRKKGMKKSTKISEIAIEDNEEIDTSHSKGDNLETGENNDIVTDNINGDPLDRVKGSAGTEPNLVVNSDEAEKVKTLLQKGKNINRRKTTSNITTGGNKTEPKGRMTRRSVPNHKLDNRKELSNSVEKSDECMLREVKKSAMTKSKKSFVFDSADNSTAEDEDAIQNEKSFNLQDNDDIDHDLPHSDNIDNHVDISEKQDVGEEQEDCDKGQVEDADIPDVPEENIPDQNSTTESVLEEKNLKKQNSKRGRKKKEKENAEDVTPPKVNKKNSDISAVMVATNVRNLEELPKTPDTSLSTQLSQEEALKSGISFRHKRRTIIIPEDCAEKEPIPATSTDVHTEAVPSINIDQDNSDPHILHEDEDDMDGKIPNVIRRRSSIRYDPIADPISVTPCIVKSKDRRKSNRRVTISRKVIETSYDAGNTTSSSTQSSEQSMNTTDGAPVHIFEMTASETLDKVYNPQLNKIISPEPAPEGLRRSQRTRVQTLESYKLERPLYERRKSGGFAIVGVKPSLSEAKLRELELRRKNKLKSRKKANKRRLSGKRLSTHVELPSTLNTTVSTEITVHNPDSQEDVLLECIGTKEQAVKFGPNGKGFSADDPFFMTRSLSQPAFGAGMLEITGLKEKTMQIITKGSLIFHIIFGKMLVTIESSSVILSTSDSFFVPRGNRYSIKNLRKDNAKLHYVLLREEEEEESE